MSEYMFKTYIANGREYFIYSDDVSDDRFTQKIDFPFSESLFSLLDLDIWKWEPQIKKIDRALLNLYRTRDARYTEDVFFTLQSLSDVHIFFKLLFLDWSKRLNEAEKDNFAHASDMLPHKAIAHIPSNIDYAQKQIKDLLERVLDMDASKRSVASRLYDYYKDPYPAFSFVLRRASKPAQIRPKSPGGAGTLPGPEPPHTRPHSGAHRLFLVILRLVDTFPHHLLWWPPYLHDAMQWEARAAAGCSSGCYSAANFRRGASAWLPPCG